MAQAQVQYDQVEKIAGLLISEAIKVFPDSNSIRHKWIIEIKGFNLNAAAHGNGKISIGRRLNWMFTEHELAHVIGHEIAHNVKNHVGLRGIITYFQTEVRKNGFKNQKQKEDVISFFQKECDRFLLEHNLRQKLVNETLDFFNLDIQTMYFRANEFEADRIGMELATRAGYNPEAAVSVLRKRLNWEKNMNIQNTDHEHPMIERRLKEVKRLLPEMKKLKVSENRKPHPVKMVISSLIEDVKEHNESINERLD